MALDHGSHILLVMVDERGQVVGTEVSERASAGGVLDRIRIRPLPSKNPPSLDALSRDEWRVFALCDGIRTTHEISSVLGIPEGMVRLIVESLRARGYLSDVVVEVG
ncbi:MAG: hypothetical protein QI223_05540 [Candidatus Korarchaeota archaeon]|nr:hypothetical protein [Candidatus Korarchaeota archaeon]